MPTEKLYSPDSLDAALDLMHQHGSDLLILAGGTVAMRLLNEGLTQPGAVMSLHRAKMNDVRSVNSHLEIGATTTLTFLAQMTGIPVLANAARQVGGWAIRNMATVAGNLFVPPPAGDVAVALLALDAQVVAAKTGGERKMPLDQFFTGFMQTALAPDELITRLEVPQPSGKTAYIKFGRRELNSPAVVAVAARIEQNAEGIVTDARIALGAASDYPMRAKQAEAALVGHALNAESIAQAADLAQKESNPSTDAIASEWYRRKMVGVFVKRALSDIT